MNEVLAVALSAAVFGYWFGFWRGQRAVNAREANVTELGRWLAKAIAGVRSNHKFHGDGVVTTSKGIAKLGNGESYVVTVEMERR